MIAGHFAAAGSRLFRTAGLSCWGEFSQAVNLLNTVECQPFDVAGDLI